MLARQFRLTTPHTSWLKTLRTPLFTLKIAQTSNDVSRFGFVVSKKIDKNATVRNSLRRKFQASIQELLPMIYSGNDYLLIIASGSKDQTQKQIKNALEQLFRQQGIL